METKKIKLASFWENKDKNGNMYLNGYLNGAPLRIYKNTFKKDNTNEPDYHAYIFDKNMKEQDSKENFIEQDGIVM